MSSKPSDQTARFVNGYWVSEDGHWRWDGQRWMPNPPRRSVPVYLGAALGALVIVLAGGLVYGTCNPSMAQQNRVDINAATLPAQAQAIRVWQDALLSLSSQPGRLSLLGNTGRVLHTAEVGLAPDAMNSLGVNNDVWVANAGDGTVTRVNYDKLQFKWQGASTISVGGRPVSISIEPQASDAGLARNVFVADAVGSRVVEIDAKTNRVTRQFELTDPPSALTWEGSRLLVASFAAGTWGCLDPTDRQSVVTLEMSGRLSAFAEVWDSASQIYRVAALFPDQGTVALIDPEKCAITSEIDVGVGSTQLTTVTDESSFYVLNPITGTITEIKTADPRHPQTTVVGPGATSFAVEPTSGIWVGYKDGKIVRLGAKGVPRATFPIDFQPVMMDAMPDSVWAVSTDTRAAEFDLHYVYM